MPERYRRQSALAHLHLDARALADAVASDAGVEMSEAPFRDMINLRGDGSDAAFTTAAGKALSLGLPMAANTSASKRGGTAVLWLGPDEWLIAAPAGKGDALADKLRRALGSLHAALTPLGDGRTVIRLSGPRARDVLSKGCPLDLHPRVFGPGQCAQTILGRCDMLLHQPAQGRGAPDTFEIYVARSFAEYAWTWLEDAAGEYGVRVGTA